MESHDQMGCETQECPMPCINNCGFFGRASTMNMCSKCYKDALLKQEQERLAASSIENIMNGSSNGNRKGLVVAESIDVQAGVTETKIVSRESSSISSLNKSCEVSMKEHPNHCSTCRKRVGLTGFNCTCGSLFCAVHRYSDKHNCDFDYRTAARDAIAKENPVVKAEKLDKI
ncbi:zinc finger A20 and AN1 domain-containing stress-associated protein 8-like [Momordica charantia]|uniref:Zinc finger A20 and AN1 domain-containing stress-associated protein 8-like n=1 Tax=Momordica charantia TaxID=3673 RepID=A0A6J1DFD5_MOMCH|nr:zinc finger A20 and AN1 domain-containing stress-associated protein 8-like [Momordica charantia]XP_022151671.1 zinc finger A20 and AN1 domain-containing stress-associated protein 8-like [Momordica charantia]